MRLDLYLAENGIAQSRTFAKTLITGGYVTVDAKPVTKASFDVTEGMAVEVTGVPYSFASRGGVKLEAALDFFNIDTTNAVCVDIGASSGGFTDCLLSRGASKVYAVDSGTDQLAQKLRADGRVVNIEGFNARALDADVLGEHVDIAVCDVSFISQTLILPAVKKVLKPNGIYVGLIKPQFECGREGLGKGGIVRDKKVVCSAVTRVIRCAAALELGVVGLIPSPIYGGDGNREFLMLCSMGCLSTVSDDEINKVVYSL